MATWYISLGAGDIEVPDDYEESNLFVSIARRVFKGYPDDFEIEIARWGDWRQFRVRSTSSSKVLQSIDDQLREQHADYIHTRRTPLTRGYINFMTLRIDNDNIAVGTFGKLSKMLHEQGLIAIDSLPHYKAALAEDGSVEGATEICLAIAKYVQPKAKW